MAERPILFSTPMVRAILDGTKTQTRRVAMHSIAGVRVPRLARFDARPSRCGCPYGVPGDRLWVKETWRPLCEDGSWNVQIDYAADGASRYLYDGEFEPGDWIVPKAAARGNVSPLFMPRWASRLTLRITDVRVERLQEISEEDAQAEGVVLGPTVSIQGSRTPHRVGFYRLWESLNAKSAPWSSNPWVWVIAFERVEGRADA